LEFNGKMLTIIVRESDSIQRISFQAVSGKPQAINGKYYFTYEKERQMLEGEGAIPEGEYYITPLSENVDDGVQEWDKIGVEQKVGGWLSFVGKKIGSWAKATPAWGTIRIPIQPKEITLKDSKGNVIIRNNFFIHGGAAAGSAGCIDLWENNNSFFKILLEYTEKYKDKILKNQGKIPLIVKYEDSTKVECDNVDLFGQSIDTKYCKPVK